MTRSDRAAGAGGEQERFARHAAVSAALARIGDAELLGLLDAAHGTGAGEGFGGRTATLDLEGAPVFVKRVPLTERELRPENRRSTANLFGLPAFCQYGIGSPGFGAWRELAAHLLTTRQALDGGHQRHPLLHHWRVLPDPSFRLPAELADVERAVAFWDGSAAMRERLLALDSAPASLVLAMEHLPHTLGSWLTGRLAEGGEAADRALRMADRELTAGAAAMRRAGLLHFDAHFENVLTDGHRLYFADLGLATSPGFELTAAERDFCTLHTDYDRTYTATHLTNWLTTALTGHRGAERDDFVRAWAEGDRTTPMPPAAAGILTRYAPLATVMGAFYAELQHHTRRARYPAAQAAHALAAIDRRSS